MFNVLIYHELVYQNCSNKNKYFFTTEDFNLHLKIIQGSGYSVSTVNELLNKLNSSLSKDIFDILITFDDGHKSNYELSLPIIQEYGLKATYFITTNWIDQKNYMNEYEINQLAYRGMSIQSHAHSHRFLDDMSIKEIFWELNTSKAILESITGQKVTCLSIPGGRFNKKVVQCAKEIGYKAIFTSLPFQFYRESGLWVVGRIGVRNPLSISGYKKIIYPTRLFMLKKKLETKGKNILKYILGGNLYYLIWKYNIKKGS